MSGKAAMRGLGSYPAVSLAEARKAAAATTQTVSESAPEQEPVPTFWEAARRLIESRRPTWSNPKHAQQWHNTILTYTYTLIGTKPVDQITDADVTAVLDPIWMEKPETTSRMRQRMETVLDWAAARGYRSDFNPAGKHIL